MAKRAGIQAKIRKVATRKAFIGASVKAIKYHYKTISTKVIDSACIGRKGS